MRSLSKNIHMRIVSFLLFLERLYTFLNELFNLFEVNFAMHQDILKNFKSVKNNILKICKKINRNPANINIVAVSKKQPIENIKILLDAGHNCFGENRLEEAKEKWKDLKYKNTNIHFIGALQSKKVKDIIGAFNVVETLDTESSVKKIANYKLNNNKFSKKLFIQINLGKEKQKRGILINETENFLKMCREKYELQINGAMCIPPNNNSPEKYFQVLRDTCMLNNVKEISMGMSNDYEKAIEFGSTNIRIGTIIFGKRN